MSDQKPKRKILLMGRSGAGKSSMRNIIFANYVPRDTAQLGPTIDVEYTQVRFLGNMLLNLWDCGGQRVFMDNYLEAQRKHIFTNVAVVIYVFDVSRKDPEDNIYFKNTMEALRQNSESARVFVLIHKIDLVNIEERENAVDRKRKELQEIYYKDDLRTYQTTIWSETLYKAWSDVVYSLLPHSEMIERNLYRFGTTCIADEVVLFERATFLVVAHAELRKQRDPTRHERISSYIKQFKFSCSRLGAHIGAMEISAGGVTIYADVFTQNTYIMVVTSDVKIMPAAMRLNMLAAKRYFQDFLGEQNGTGGSGLL